MRRNADVTLTVNWTRWDELQHRYVLFSGGKDSLATLLYCRDNLRDVEVIHVNTGISLPGVQDYVKKITNILNVPLIMLTPDKKFEDLVEAKCLPDYYRRWCCYWLKLRPVRQFMRQVQSKVQFLGIRRSESRRRKNYPSYWFDRYCQCWVINPIIDWTDNQVDVYIQKHGVPLNPVSEKLGFSGECFCGAFAKPQEFMVIKALYPEFYQRLVKIEELRCKKWTYIYRKGKRIPLKTIPSQQTLTFKSEP